MISYAQNAEDVILARAFAGRREGFYVDVGAASPIEASVTRHFYEAGWHGINIEPIQKWAEELRSIRPRDINIQVCAGETVGTIRFLVVREDSALSTGDPIAAERLRVQGYTVDELDVEVTTLNTILSDVEPQLIDFLKIDVEGFERDVLRGIDLDRWRPVVIVIEATEPNSLLPTYDKWEELITSHRYGFASTDGVNRYYVRDEDRHLAPLLVPANAVDDFVMLRERLLHEEISRLRLYIQDLTSALDRDPQQRADATDSEKRTTVPSNQTGGNGRSRGAMRIPDPPTVIVDRLVIASSPQSGDRHLGALLSRELGVIDQSADHPADVDWEAMPNRAILRLCWPPTEYFRRLLEANGFWVVTIARHPFETLLSVLRLVQVEPTITDSWLGGNGGAESMLFGAAPTSEEFLSWACGERARAIIDVTAGWWRDPGVLRVRFDDFHRDPDGQVGRLCEVAGATSRETDQIGKTSRRSPLGLEEIPGGWQEYLTQDAAALLSATHNHALALMGFTDDLKMMVLPDADVAYRNWLGIGSRSSD